MYIVIVILNFCYLISAWELKDEDSCVTTCSNKNCDWFLHCNDRIVVSCVYLHITLFNEFYMFI